MLEDFRHLMSRRGQNSHLAKVQQAGTIMDAKITSGIGYRKVLVTHAPTHMNGVEYDAKFATHTYTSITGDAVDYYLQFKTGITIPIGSYVDIEDENGRYERWLVVLSDDRPMFRQYYILKCNWTLKWTVNGVHYKCLGVQRIQKSYGSGLWTDRLTTIVQNDAVFWMPTTPYTQTLSYNNHVLINDYGRAIPLKWEVSKVEDTKPIGICKITFKQAVANIQTDCGEYGLADYCKCTDANQQKPELCEACPYEAPTFIDAGYEMPKISKKDGIISVIGARTIRVNGKDKFLTANFKSRPPFGFGPCHLDWVISMLNNDLLQCAINVTVHRTDHDEALQLDVEMSADSPTNIRLDEIVYDYDHDTASCMIKCLDGDDTVMMIHIGFDDAKPHELQIRCPQIYSMVGNVLHVEVSDDNNHSCSGIDLEVIS